MRRRSQYRCREARTPQARKTLILLCSAVSVAALCSAWVRAQSSPAQSFDIISIKPNHSLNAGTALRNGIPGHFGTTNLSLRDVIEYAYNVKPGQIEGLPAWADSEKYDIDAKLEDTAAEQEKSLPWLQRAELTRTRVQSLLADRFRLQLHHQTKDMAVLALAIAKGGPKLSEEAATPAPADPHSLPPGSLGMMKSGGNWIIAANQSPLRNLIQALTGQPEVSGRILLDQTGLSDKYTFTLQWTPENLSDPTPASSDAPGPSLFTALEEQLGLRLESTKTAVDVLVVDHVERPTAN
jgi:uncharacterized protein (TIGR03435 family)